MAGIISRVVEDSAYSLYVEQIGFSMNSKLAMSAEELLPLIAVARLYLDVPKKTADEPTPEEMLSIGIAIGMCEAERKWRQYPKASAWRLVARLRM